MRRLRLSVYKSKFILVVALGMISLSMLSSVLNAFSILIPYFFTGLLLIVVSIIVFFIYRKLYNVRLLKSVTQTYRGTYSERTLVHQLLKMGIPSDMIFHDLYLKKDNGKYSQSDVIAITTVGIIVFEVKDHSGWLFGSGHQQQWTQVLNYGREKNRFYNPVLQNNTHIEEWKKRYPEFQNIPFFSVIIFYGDCELKKISNLPYNCYVINDLALHSAYESILTENAPITVSNIETIRSHFLEAAANGNNPEIKQQHIQNIYEMQSREKLYR